MDDKVVEELNAQITFRLDVILDVDETIDFDVDGKSIGCELCRYFFIDLDKHVVRALDNTLL